MNPLSLQHINDKAPYRVNQSTEGVHLFSTSKRVNYSIAFMEDNPLGDCDTYQFGIRRINNVSFPYAPKVESTILAFINEFFACNLNILLYICDTSDHREEARNRLFLTWFEHTLNQNASPFALPMRMWKAKAFMPQSL